MKYTSQHGSCVVSIHVGRDVQLKICYLIILISLYGIALKVFPSVLCGAV